MVIESCYNSDMKLEDKRQWSHNIAVEIAAQRSVRVDKNLLFQFIDSHLGGVGGYPRIYTITQWIKKYDRTFNQLGKQHASTDC